MLYDHIEDKYLFICICQLYKQLRSRYISKYYYKRRMFKFIELALSNDNSKTVCNLAKCVLKHFNWEVSQLRMLIFD